MKTVEEIIAKLEEDLKDYKESYEYAVRTNGLTPDIGAYEEAEELLQFIKGDT